WMASAEMCARMLQEGRAVAAIEHADHTDHTITGDQAFGVQVYGYGQYTSYWSPRRARRG
ncbi:MAG TPA: hypothetical protein VEY14_00405, partial [Nocardioidaceae bacterium]|nr:hypothetical protein [Nocardioidaceae bacterium]